MATPEHHDAGLAGRPGRGGWPPRAGPGLNTGGGPGVSPRRIPNPKDRRSVLIEIDRERVMASIAPLFVDWVHSLEDLYADYSDEQLETILHFLNEAARRQQEATRGLTGDLPPGPRR